MNDTKTPRASNLEEARTMAIEAITERHGPATSRSPHLVYAGTYDVEVDGIPVTFSVEEAQCRYYVGEYEYDLSDFGCVIGDSARDDLGELWRWSGSDDALVPVALGDPGAVDALVEALRGDARVGNHRVGDDDIFTCDAPRVVVGIVEAAADDYYRGLAGEIDAAEVRSEIDEEVDAQRAEGLPTPDLNALCDAAVGESLDELAEIALWGHGDPTSWAEAATSALSAHGYELHGGGDGFVVVAK